MPSAARRPMQKRRVFSVNSLLVLQPSSSSRPSMRHNRSGLSQRVSFSLLALLVPPSFQRGGPLSCAEIGRLQRAWGQAPWRRLPSGIYEMTVLTCGILLLDSRCNSGLGGAVLPEERGLSLHARSSAARTALPWMWWLPPNAAHRAHIRMTTDPLYSTSVWTEAHFCASHSLSVRSRSSEKEIRRKIVRETQKVIWELTISSSVFGAVPILILDAYGLWARSIT